MNLLNTIYKELDMEFNEMIKIRRYLHANPELSFQEVNTAKYIADYYEKLGFEIKKEYGGGHGITLDIKSGKRGKNIAIRADFDALPIQEETGLDFSSKNNGVMHACAHDGHTAYLMVLAKIFHKYKKNLRGKIRIIHQPAEESPPGGAIGMIKEGVLESIDHVIGCHIMSQLELGKVYFHKGDTQSGRAKFILKVQGKGGHGSSPHEANDAILVASHIVIALQSIVSRRLSPFDSGVVTIGSFDGKGSFNIIKDSVILEGDVRIMSEDLRKIVRDQIATISEGIGKAFGATISIEYKDDYPVLHNNIELTEFAEKTLREIKFPEKNSVENSGPIPPSEDFSYYAKERPACFFYIGGNKEGSAYPHHHPKFDFDENAMLIAAKSVTGITVKYLEE